MWNPRNRLTLFIPDPLARVAHSSLLFLPSDFFPFPLSPLLSPFDVRQTWEFEVKWLQCHRGWKEELRENLFTTYLFFPVGGGKEGWYVYPEEYCVWCVYRRRNGEMLWLPSLTPLGEERNSLWFVCFIVSGLEVGVGPYRWICTHNVYAHI